MAPICELLECKNQAVTLLGHPTCLYHLPCVSDGLFSPARCSHCISYINEFFVNKASFQELAYPRDELDRFVRRLRNFGKREGFKVSFTKLASELKSKSTKWSFFSDLKPLELVAAAVSDEPDHRLSSASSMADSNAGSARSESRSRSRSSSRASSRSSRRRQDIEDARWAKLFGEMAEHNSRLLALENQKPVVSALNPLPMSVDESSVTPGPSGLSSVPSAAVSGPSRVAAGLPAAGFTRAVPEEPVVLVRAAGMPSSVVTSSVLPSGVHSTVVFSSAGVSVPLPPVVTVSSPIPSVPDPFSLASSALLSPHPPISAPYSPISPVRPPPGFPPRSSPSLPVSIPFVSSGVGAAVVRGAGPSSSGEGGPSVTFRSGRGFALDFPGGRPFVPRGDGLGQGDFVSGRDSDFVQGGLRAPPAAPGEFSEVLEFDSVRSEVVVSVSSVDHVPEAGSFVVSASQSESARLGSDPSRNSGCSGGGGFLDRRNVSFARSSILLDNSLVAGGGSDGGGSSRGGLSGQEAVAGPSSFAPSFSSASQSRFGGGVGEDSCPSGRPSSSSRPKKRGFSIFRQDGSPARADEYDAEDDAFSDDSQVLEENYSAWKALEEPWVVLKDGDLPVSVFNRVNRNLVPWEHTSWMEEDGIKYFAIKLERNKFNVFPRKLVSDKKRVSAFCSQFPHMCSGLDKSFCEEWGKGFDHVSEFTGELGKKLELPMSESDMEKMFDIAGTSSSVKTEALKPSLILFLSCYKELVSCLPVKQFTTESVAPSLFQQAKDLVSLPSDLASEEHGARINLLSLTVVLSAIRGFSVLAKKSASPSALEAAGFSLLTGILPFMSYAWNQAYARFCKARTALRRSVFQQPLHTLATRLIISMPFSRYLFDRDVVKKIQDDFQKDNMTWKKLLKFKKEGKSGGGARSRPYRKPFFRVPFPGRGGRGGGQGGNSYQQGGQRGAGRGFGKGRRSNRRNNRDRGRQ